MALARVDYYMEQENGQSLAFTGMEGNTSWAASHLTDKQEALRHFRSAQKEFPGCRLMERRHVGDDRVQIA